MTLGSNVDQHVPQVGASDDVTEQGNVRPQCDYGLDEVSSGITEVVTMEVGDDDTDDGPRLEDTPATAPPEGELEANAGDDEDSWESRRIKVAKLVMRPSAEETRKHRCAGHVLYRPWCTECVQGGAKYGRSPSSRRTPRRNDRSLQ